MFARLDRVELKQLETDKKLEEVFGASIKDAGKKSFGITKIEDKDLIQSLLNKVR